MRKIQFRGIDMAGAYAYGLLSVKRRGKKTRYYIVNDAETVQVHQSSVEQFIATDSDGCDIFEGDTVVRITEWNDGIGEYVRVEAMPMRATFEDYRGILDGEIVHFTRATKEAV